jgi:hypothetical protein
MIVTYKERQFLTKYTCKDSIIKITVQKFAFQQGDLLYFKKDSFNYIVIAKNDLIEALQ